MNVNDFTTGELNEIIALNNNLNEAKEHLLKAFENLNKLDDIYPTLKDYIFEGLHLTTNLKGIRSELSSMEHTLCNIENCISPY